MNPQTRPKRHPSARLSDVLILADPDEQSRNKLFAELHQLPWEILATSDADGIVNEVRSHTKQRNVVLVSFPMPGLDAEALSVRLRDLPDVSVYLIFRVARRAPRAAARAFEMGANDVVTTQALSAELCARLQHASEYLSLESFRDSMCKNGVLLADMAVAALVHGGSYLNGQLSQEIERSRRYGHALSVIIAGAEHTGSAAEGALRASGRFLREHIRKDIDWVARYADRSFAIVLPETGAKNALRTAERLCQTLRQANLTSAGLRNGMIWNFGFSACDQTMSPQEANSSILLDTAENYLRSARRQGPNAVAGGYAIGGPGPGT